MSNEQWGFLLFFFLFPLWFVKPSVAVAIVLSLYFHSFHFAHTFLSKPVKHQRNPVLQITLFDECFCYLLNKLLNKASESFQLQQNTTYHINYLIKKMKQLSKNVCEKKNIQLKLLHT